MRLVSIVATLTILSLPNLSWAASEMDTRVTRLENIVANELNIQLLNQLEAMQQEISELRGKFEEQQNSVQNLNQKQDKIFINLDTRINNISETKPKTSDLTVNNQPIEPPSAQTSAVPETSSVVPNVSTAETISTGTPAAFVPALEKPITSVAYIPNADKTEQGIFNAANNYVNNRQYGEAIIEFKDLLWQYPQGKYASEAYYWLGELYLMQWQQNRHDATVLAQSKESFNTVINRYQGSMRESDALLKLGLIEVDLEQWAAAKEILQKVVNKNPQGATARVAENTLKRIEQKR